MSKDKIIAKESLSAYERWELPNVEVPPEPVVEHPEEEDEQARLPTAEEIEAIQKEAYLEAYNAGYEKGREEARQAVDAELRATVGRMEQVFRALAEPLADVDEQVEQELAELAVAMAQQIIRRELHIDPGQVVAVVRESLSVLPAAAQDIKVLLHPDDAALVREAMSVPDEDQRWRLIEEPALTRGGCRVVSEHSRIDATLETQVATVVARVMGGERQGDDGEREES